MAFRGVAVAFLASCALAYPGYLQCGDVRFAVGNAKKCMALDIKDKQEHPGLRFSANSHTFTQSGEVRLTVDLQTLGPYDNSTGQDPYGIYFAMLANTTDSTDYGSFTRMPDTVSLKDNTTCPHQVYSGSDTCKQAVGLTWTAGPKTCGDVSFTMLWGNGPGESDLEAPFLHRTVITVSGDICGGSTKTTTTTAAAGVSWVCTVCAHVYDSDADGHGMAFEDLPDDWLCPVCSEKKAVYEKRGQPTTTTTTTTAAADVSWVCTVCAHVYDSDADGQGMAFEDLPDDWLCPVCSKKKAAYEKSGQPTTTTTTTTAAVDVSWVCTVCAHVYDSDADGQGMAFEDLPDDWLCPVCSKKKAVYETSEHAVVLV